MAKFVAIAAVCLAAILAVAVGQGEVEHQRLKDMQCRQEVQESPLDACRQVLHRQLTSRTRYGFTPFKGSTGLRMQCCQQLQDVSRECRCAAIHRMVRGYEQSMPPLEEGGGGYYGEGTHRCPCTQQGARCPCTQQGGHYGEGTQCPCTQQGRYYGEGTQCPCTQQGGYYGEGAQRPQQREGYYGYGEMARRRRQQQGGGYYGEAERQGAEGCRCGRQGRGTRYPLIRPGAGQLTTRVRLGKVRQYAARLPMMCRLEPQECSVFAAGDYY